MVILVWFTAVLVRQERESADVFLQMAQHQLSIVLELFEQFHFVFMFHLTIIFISKQLNVAGVLTCHNLSSLLIIITGVVSVLGTIHMW